MSFVCLGAEAEDYRLAHTFRAPQPAEADLFGTAVDLEGDVAVIRSNAGFIDPDLVSVTHLFERQANGDWTEAATFESDGMFGDGGHPFIGQEVAIDRGTVVVGMQAFGPFGSSSGNALFAVRELSGWAAELDSSFPLLEALSVSTNGVPGRSVDISGGYAIASDPGATFARRGIGQGVGVRLNGAARVYELSDDGLWRQTQVLAPDGPSRVTVDSVAIDGETAIVLDRDGEGSGDVSGVYFYERQAGGAWTVSDSLLAPEADPNAFFTSKVRLGGDTALIRDIATGITTVLERDPSGSWNQTEQFTPPPANQLPLTGNPYALEGDLLAHTVVGAGDDPNTVELYRRLAPGEWSLVETIVAPDTPEAADFGASLALDNGRLLVGAFGASRDLTTGPPPPAGAVYLFTPIPEPATALLLVCSLLAIGSHRMRSA